MIEEQDKSSTAKDVGYTTLWIQAGSVWWRVILACDLLGAAVQMLLTGEVDFEWPEEETELEVNDAS